MSVRRIRIILSEQRSRCWSPNWNEPHTASGTPRFGILTNPYPNRFGESPFQYGDCFFGVFFQSRTRSAFSHQKSPARIENTRYSITSWIWCTTASSAHASYKGFGWNKTKPQWPTHRNTSIDVGVLGCGPIQMGEGAVAPFNGVHILGKIRPAGGLITWPNGDGRT